MRCPSTCLSSQNPPKTRQTPAWPLTITSCSVGKLEGCSCGKDGSTSITKGDSGGNGNSCSSGEGDSRGMALTSGHGIVSAWSHSGLEGPRELDPEEVGESTVLPTSSSNVRCWQWWGKFVDWLIIKIVIGVMRREVIRIKAACVTCSMAQWSRSCRLER